MERLISTVILRLITVLLVFNELIFISPPTSSESSGLGGGVFAQNINGNNNNLNQQGGIVGLPSLSLRLSRRNAGYSVAVPVKLGGRENSAEVYHLIVDTGSSDIVYVKGTGGYNVALATDSLESKDFQGSGTVGLELLVDSFSLVFENMRGISDDFQFLSVIQPNSNIMSPSVVVERAGIVYAGTTKSSYAATNSTWPDLHDWTGINGVFGIGMLRVSLFYPTSLRDNFRYIIKGFGYGVALRAANISTISTSSSSGNNNKNLLFVLELGQNGKNADFLHIGGIPESYLSQTSPDGQISHPSVRYGFIWSEQQPVPSYLMTDYQFSMYHLQVCDLDLLSNYSGNWFATIDSGSVCLALPGFLFDSVMRWIPSECTFPLKNFTLFRDNVRISQTFPADQRKIFNADTLRSTCLVKRGVDITDLPSLKFQLEEEGPLVSIPLSSLLIEVAYNGEERQAYCITRIHEGAGTKLAPISFGTKVIEAMKAVALDIFARRVGFPTPNSKAGLVDSVRYCSMKAQCIGEQSYYAPFNICIDPPCSSFFFRRVDPVLKKCTYIEGFEVLVLIPLMICVVADIALYRIRLRISQKVRQT